MSRVRVSVSFVFMLLATFGVASVIQPMLPNDGVPLETIYGKDGCPHCEIDYEDYWECMSPFPVSNTCDQRGCVSEGSCPGGRMWRQEAIPEHVAGVFDPPQYDEHLVTSTSVSCYWNIECITGPLQNDKSCYPGKLDPNDWPLNPGTCGILNAQNPGCKTCTAGPLDLWDYDVTSKVDPRCVDCLIADPNEL